MKIECLEKRKGKEKDKVLGGTKLNPVKSPIKDHTRKGKRISSPSKRKKGEEDEIFVTPDCPCKKCNSTIWIPSTITLTWYCYKCGNNIYYTYGTLHQQIESIMNSPTRKNEFVTAADGKYIYPKKNNSVKRINYDKSQ